MLLYDEYKITANRWAACETHIAGVLFYREHFIIKRKVDSVKNESTLSFFIAVAKGIVCLLFCIFVLKFNLPINTGPVFAEISV